MKRIVFMSAAFLPVIAWAQSGDNYRCTFNNLVRRVEIIYETGVAVPCEVHYYKDDEAPGQRQVLWQASNESGYCESRTRDFVARLQDMGWSCAAAAAGGAAPAGPTGREAADDTDVLEAAEPPD